MDDLSPTFPSLPAPVEVPVWQTNVINVHQTISAKYNHAIRLLLREEGDQVRLRAAEVALKGTLPMLAAMVKVGLPAEWALQATRKLSHLASLVDYVITQLRDQCVSTSFSLASVITSLLGPL